MFIKPTYPHTTTHFAVVTPRGKIVQLFDDRRRADEFRHKNSASWTVVVVTTQFEMDAAEIDFKIDRHWSLLEYIQWLNRDTGRDNSPKLVEDPDYWIHRGINTARRLADYLDECVANEIGAERLYELNAECGPRTVIELEA